MDKVFAVIGLGSFGRQLCETLMEKGGKVIAFDKNPALVEEMSETVTRAVLLDSTDEVAISQAALEDADMAIVAIGDNIEASILTTAILKELSVPYVMARAVSETHQKVLKKIGADEIINLEVDEGIRLATRLIAPEVLDRIPVSSGISLAEIFLAEEFSGKKAKDLNLKKNFNLALVMINRSKPDIDDAGNPVKNEQSLIPEDDTVFEKNDILMVLGKNADIDEFISESTGR